MAIERNKIYVDLSSLTGCVCDVDTSGAPICSSDSTTYPMAGTYTYPLNFPQFRKHAQYRYHLIGNGGQIKYHIKGDVDISVNEGFTDETAIFIIKYIQGAENTNKYDIMFTNWEDSVDESYKFKLSYNLSATNNWTGSENPPLYFLSSGKVAISINNMDIQTGDGVFSNTTVPIGDIRIKDMFTYYPEEWEYHQIKFNNCRFYSNGNGTGIDNSNTLGKLGSFHVINYPQVAIDNCIFYSEQNSLLSVSDYNMSTGIVASPFYYFRNSIFINTNRFMRYSHDGQDFVDVDTGIVVRRCVFTETYENLQKPIISEFQLHEQNMLFYDPDPSSGADRHNQYSYSPPTLTWDIFTLTNDDYYYLNGWSNISVNNVYVSTTEYENAYTYGTRDGIGALYFSKIPFPIIGLNPKTCPIGTNVIINNNVPNFDSDFEPSLYTWTILSQDYTTTALNGQITYLVNTNGAIPVYLKIDSHNLWYSAYGNNTINATIDPNKVGVDIITNYDESLNDITTFTVEDNIAITVRVSIGDLQPCIDKITIMYTDGVSDFVYTVPKDSNGVSMIKNPTTSTRRTYKYVQDEWIYVVITTTNNEVFFFNKKITFVDVVHNVYYVDLSKDFDGSGLELAYGIYDNFEDDLISNAFDSGFVQKYGVSAMYDEKVAIGTEKTLLTAGIKRGDFLVEWSFVRTEMGEKPFMYVKIDNDEYSIAWNYLYDSIIIENGEYYRYQYGIFVKDLECRNSLNTLGIRLECSYIGVDGFRLSLLYSFDNGVNWIYSTLNKIIADFADVRISLKGTENTGCGYIDIEANNVDPNEFKGCRKGDVNCPYSYDEFVSKIQSNDLVLGDTFKCRNWRRIVNRSIVVNRNKSCSIMAWDSLKYGPWMLLFDNPEKDVDFVGTTLFDGIITNIIGQYPANLLITNAMDMFIRWNGVNNKIGITRMPIRYAYKDYRSDILGSTISSESGFFTKVGV